MSKTTQTRSEDAPEEELRREQVGKIAQDPKPGKVAAPNEVYNAKS